MQLNYHMYGDDFGESVCLFVCMLPFAPFASILIYIIETHDLIEQIGTEYSNKIIIQQVRE